MVKEPTLYPHRQIVEGLTSHDFVAGVCPTPIPPMGKRLQLAPGRKVSSGGWDALPMLSLESTP